VTSALADRVLGDWGWQACGMGGGLPGHLPARPGHRDRHGHHGRGSAPGCDRGGQPADVRGWHRHRRPCGALELTAKPLTCGVTSLLVAVPRSYRLTSQRWPLGRRLSGTSREPPSHQHASSPLIASTRHSYLVRWYGAAAALARTGCRAARATPPAAAPGAVLAPAPVPVPAAATAAAAAGVPAAAVAARAAAPAVALAAAAPVRATAAPASRVPAALLDQHLERALAPSCRAPPRRAPRAHGNDLRAPGDDSPPGPPPTTRRQTCSTSCALTCACPPSRTQAICPRPAERHAGAPDRTGVLIASWT
jgi:hypothetical protein